jgi:Tol biopolymer transport system component
VTTPPTSAGDIHPAVSPDGHFLVFRRHKGIWTGELYWLSLGKGVTPIGDPHRVTAGLRADHPAWMPDSREILFSAQGGLWRVAIAGKSAPTRLPYVGQDGLMPVISKPRPGRLPRLVYVHSFEDSNIWRIGTPAPGAPATSAPAIAISSTRHDVNPNLSPDGRRVAFDSNRSGNSEVWVADMDGSNAVQLTSLGATSGFGKWSPDGRSIVFHSNAEDEWHAYSMPASGGKPFRLPGSGWPSFSRDGGWVYFNSRADGRGEICKMPISGGDAIPVTRNGAVAGMESVDGKFFYYRQIPEGPGPLWRVPAFGGQPLKLLDRIYDFFVIGQGIYYIDQRTEESHLQFLNFATGKSTLVARSLGQVRRGLTASADGRIILYARVDSSVDDLMIVENFR